jgi:ELWxxDGT repeat protein
MRRSLSGAWGVVAILAIALVTLVPAAGAQTTAVLVKDIFPGSQGSFPLSLTNINGTLFFSANFSGDGVTFDGRELWKSDGTAAGTVLVKDIRPGTMSSLEEEFPTTFVTVGGAFFFRADDGINGRELWKSDGTAAGTVLVKNINPGCCDTFGNGFNSSPGGVPPEFTDVSGTLFFSASDGTAGRELWKSDGTAAGTVLVKDIQPGTFPGGQLRNGLPQFLTNLNGTLVFGADDGINGRELWKSDGTGAGTVLLKDINPGAGSAVPFETSPFESGPTSFFNNVNGMLFFRADDGTTGRELWKSDGTAAGTVRVKDINPGTPGSAPQFLTDVNGTLFFSANDGTHGQELWKSNGTAAGTSLVENIFTAGDGSGGSFPAELTNVNGTLFFAADDGEHGFELWKSDGTLPGTRLVEDINPDLSNSSNPGNPGGMVSLGGILLFTATDGDHGIELWRSDGTVAGTRIVKDIVPGSGTSFPSELTVAGDKVFFRAFDPNRGDELWKSNGTAAGTVPVKNINPGSTSSNPTELTGVDGTVFFQASDGENGREPWVSDGTPTGTTLVKNIASGSISSDPANFVDVGGTVFFSADDLTRGEELWRTNGTPAGTSLVRNINPGGNSSQPAELVSFAGLVFFRADDGSTGFELWKSNGTFTGTTRVKNINPGIATSFPQNLTPVGTKLFFAADDGSRGIELWQSDGTTAGTTIARNINAGSASSGPGDLVNVGGTLFFSANNGTRGVELWKAIPG